MEMERIRQIIRNITANFDLIKLYNRFIIN